MRRIWFDVPVVQTNQVPTIAPTGVVRFDEKPAYDEGSLRRAVSVLSRGVSNVSRPRNRESYTRLFGIVVRVTRWICR